MSKSTVANRYAEALFSVAQKQNIVDEVNQELQEMTKVVSANRDFISLLTNPKFSSERKKEIVSELFKEANSILLNTIKLLIDKKRINELVNIAEAFKTLAADAQGTAEATVYSTRELTEEEKKDISTSFAKLVGKESLNITNVIEPSVIGGVRVQIGNMIFDNTVANKLDSLRRTLVVNK
ncbi:MULTISPECIES: F0F1 ATP synthase subunit delta [Ureibacillus]|jgi:F-type H+-transporting ATPase subunit delta|uniref:ATP synthase subunit delta n=1 Tax=Ureibacillus thermosphaericus TaxID=51173 RepID=A0A840PV88_URETH|nr:F0F1 ATP synthase subunit delta [Ureibacillus thermosphaericus]MBB5149800.1 F-type H+-transporting ATPase subunit delta [Ureibacillus thermosphaericus]NKZ33027.1 F0F1 ATP synthase subunit delta [Ureibacillus thermosphaericus]